MRLVLFVMGFYLPATFGELGLGRDPSEDAEPRNPCQSFSSESVEHRLLSSLSSCHIHPQSCEFVGKCVSNGLINLLKTLPCETPAANFPAADCNRAAVAFVLVETLRQLLDEAIKNEKECIKAEQLTSLCKICVPDNRELAVMGFNKAEEISYGCQSVLRSATHLLEGESDIQWNMQQMQRYKLSSGISTIAFTFLSPGVLSLCSPSHLRIVTLLQCVSGALIVIFVLTQQGILYAIITAVSCTLILCVQLILITCLHKNALKRLFPHERID